MEVEVGSLIPNGLQWVEMDDQFLTIRFVSKSELAQRFGISRETLRKKLKTVKGLDTGRRQLLYPYEVKMIYEAFGAQSL